MFAHACMLTCVFGDMGYEEVHCVHVSMGNGTEGATFSSIAIKVSLGANVQNTEK